MIEVTVNSRDSRKHQEEVAHALTEFKKRTKKSGLMQELRKREEYVAPSRKRKLKREESAKQRIRDRKKSRARKDF